MHEALVLKQNQIKCITHIHITHTTYIFPPKIMVSFCIMRKLQEKLGHKQITKPNTCTGTHSHKQWKTTAPPHRTKNEIRMK